MLALFNAHLSVFCLLLFKLFTVASVHSQSKEKIKTRAEVIKKISV